MQEPPTGAAPEQDREQRAPKKKKSSSNTKRIVKKDAPPSPAKEAAPIAAPAAGAPPDVKRKARILIVEDVAMVRTTLRKILESGDHSVIEAGSAHEAMARVIVEKPDLILVDIMMPVVNGIQFCKKVKENEATRGIPVAMCTAMNQRQSIIEAIKAGACEYILKPFSRDTVLKKVEKILAGNAQPPVEPPPSASK